MAPIDDQHRGGIETGRYNSVHENDGIVSDVD
jgi:hypothetical protein